MTSRDAAGPDAPIRVVPMTRDMLDVVAELHHRSFGTRLGRRYSRALAEWFMTRQDAIAIAAVDVAGAPVGYAVGAAAGHEAALQRAMLPTVVTQLALRPWRWFDPYVLRTIGERLRPSRGSSPEPRASAPAAGPSAAESPAAGPPAAGPSLCLVAIGVSPKVRGRGVGALLLESFEARARALGARSLTLWVRKDNEAARRLYEKCGWSTGASGDAGSDTGNYSKAL